MVDIARAPKPKTGKYVMYGAGALALIVITILLARLKPAAPTVERNIISIDSVRQGDMIREVRGPGTLVPEYVRQITSLANARIDRIVAQVGQHVTPETVLLEMSNPDVDIAAMTAQQAYDDARSNLVSQRVNLQRGLLTQQTVVASAKTAQVSASQQAAEAEGMLGKKLISPFEYNTRKAAAEEAATRYDVAQQELKLLRTTIDSQIAVLEQNVDRLKQIAAFREGIKASLTLRAGDSGILQDLSAGAGGALLEPGQYVNAGMTVAKVVQPGKLKAVIRIPETQAKDVAIGQSATVDTRNGIVKGHVARIDPASSGGTVTVDVALDGALPSGARPDLNVDGTIQIQKLTNVVYTGRPAYGQDGATVGMFRLDPDGKGAQRVQVRLGVSSVNAVQIVAGLKPGDKVILSDMTQWDNTDRVRIR
ncbi:MAG: HlyD family efflux transporter periplasmic adaptor subunit [Gemmatimonadota bacterium]|nr:HlyD family efflux transporter periplasmic adaptor subunit [Gemmatimonadota bacterium]